MKIAIEAQRIFRKEKHGMDYVALETIRELQKIDQQNEYFILVSPGDDICFVCLSFAVPGWFPELHSPCHAFLF